MFGWLESNVFITGQISLVGKPERSPGGRVTKGNIYLDGSPICDDGWSQEDATVACRFDLHPLQLVNLSFSSFSPPECWDMGSQFPNGVLLMGWLRSEISLSSQRFLAKATRRTCWIVRSSKCMKGYHKNMKVLMSHF